MLPPIVNRDPGDESEREVLQLDRTEDDWPFHCDRLMIGVEYAYGVPERYDGISEYLCDTCHIRVGRWTGHVLAEDENEPRYGQRTLPSTRARAHTILEKDGDGLLRATPDSDQEGSAVACAPRQLTVDDFPELWS